MKTISNSQCIFVVIKGWYWLPAEVCKTRALEFNRAQRHASGLALCVKKFLPCHVGLQHFLLWFWFVWFFWRGRVLWVFLGGGFWFWVWFFYLDIIPIYFLLLQRDSKYVCKVVRSRYCVLLLFIYLFSTCIKALAELLEFLFFFHFSCTVT